MTKDCPRHADRGLDLDRPPLVTMCLGEFTRLDNVFDLSALGTACCSCGKLVKLTSLGENWPNYAASEQPGNF